MNAVTSLTLQILFPGEKFGVLFLSVLVAPETFGLICEDIVIKMVIQVVIESAIMIPWENPG